MSFTYGAGSHMCHRGQRIGRCSLTRRSGGRWPCLWGAVQQRSSLAARCLHPTLKRLDRKGGAQLPKDLQAGGQSEGEFLADLLGRVTTLVVNAAPHKDKMGRSCTSSFRCSARLNIAPRAFSASLRKELLVVNNAAVAALCLASPEAAFTSTPQI
jgi:hypothetical protein